jgi:hypothetical protein
MAVDRASLATEPFASPSLDLIGVVTKISMMEYVVRFRVSDARKAAILSSFTTGLRHGCGLLMVQGSPLADEEPDAPGKIGESGSPGADSRRPRRRHSGGRGAGGDQGLL